MLNRSAGVYIQRGSGAESLGAIRSPVLTGAGACGAFLVAEDSLPIRPVGLLQSQRDVRGQLRTGAADRSAARPGLGDVWRQRGARHRQRAHAARARSCREFRAGAEVGSDSFKRVDSRSGTHGSGNMGLGAYGIAHARTGLARLLGRRRGQAQSARATAESAAAHCALRAAGTVLNQETAGFIQGYNSYNDEDIARSNPNPEAFRDASSARVSAQYETRELRSATTACFELAGIYRRSRMDFLQHFLIGKPLEHNAQTSYMLSGTARVSHRDVLTTRVTRRRRDRRLRAHRVPAGPGHRRHAAGQRHPPGGPALRLHRGFDDARRHARARVPHRRRLVTVTAALRADQTNYDYDNHMIDGNTRADGVPCGAAGCLYSRPADRSDRFDNLSPRVTLSWQPGDATHAVPERLDRLPPARDDRAVPPAAPADRQPISTVRNSSRSKLGWKFRTRPFSLDHGAVLR